MNWLVSEALDSACRAEGTKHRPDYRPIAPQRNERARETLKRLLLRFLGDVPEDMTINELRKELEDA
jgi:hypothetical protein